MSLTLPFSLVIKLGLLLLLLPIMAFWLISFPAHSELARHSLREKERFC
jgi:hypothetical protein